MRITYPFLVMAGFLCSVALAQSTSQSPSYSPIPTPAVEVPKDPNASPNNGKANGFKHLQSEKPSPFGGKIRNYYIQINEYEWDYLPSGQDLYHGGPPDETPAKTWFAKSPTTIGSKYTKALYRGYTDSTFTTPLPHEAWLGTLGPVIRAEVGDQIRVLLSNQASSNNYSIHPHGVMYTLSNEGAVYEGSALGAIVSPGNTYQYVWNVPARAGPGPKDGSSIPWGYHSHVLDAADIYAGLTGAMIIYNKGSLGSNGLPKDIDREYVLQLLISDEGHSPYLERNTKAANIKLSLTNKDDFNESNMKHAINGYSFNNLPGITMSVGDRVRWYLMAYGDEPDIHAVNWHGNTGLFDNHRVDTVDLLPAMFRVVDMIPDNPGQWLIQCETTDHILGGMIGSYQVLPKKGKSSKKPSTTNKTEETSTTKSAPTPAKKASKRRRSRMASH